MGMYKTKRNLSQADMDDWVKLNDPLGSGAVSATPSTTEARKFAMRYTDDWIGTPVLSSGEKIPDAARGAVFQVEGLSVDKAWSIGSLEQFFRTGDPAILGLRRGMGLGPALNNKPYTEVFRNPLQDLQKIIKEGQLGEVWLNTNKGFNIGIPREAEFTQVGFGISPAFQRQISSSERLSGPGDKTYGAGFSKMAEGLIPSFAFQGPQGFGKEGMRKVFDVQQRASFMSPQIRAVNAQFDNLAKQAFNILLQKIKPRAATTTGPNAANPLWARKGDPEMGTMLTDVGRRSLLGAHNAATLVHGKRPDEVNKQVRRMVEESRASGWNEKKAKFNKSIEKTDTYKFLQETIKTKGLGYPNAHRPSELSRKMGTQGYKSEIDDIERILREHVVYQRIRDKKLDFPAEYKLDDYYGAMGSGTPMEIGGMYGKNILSESAYKKLISRGFSKGEVGELMDAYFSVVKGIQSNPQRLVSSLVDDFTLSGGSAQDWGANLAVNNSRLNDVMKSFSQAQRVVRTGEFDRFGGWATGFVPNFTSTAVASNSAVGSLHIGKLNEAITAEVDAGIKRSDVRVGQDSRIPGGIGVFNAGQGSIGGAITQHGGIAAALNDSKRAREVPNLAFGEVLGKEVEVRSMGRTSEAVGVALESLERKLRSLSRQVDQGALSEKDAIKTTKELARNAGVAGRDVRQLGKTFKRQTRQIGEQRFQQRFGNQLGFASFMIPMIAGFIPEGKPETPGGAAGGAIQGGAQAGGIGAMLAMSGSKWGMKAGGIITLMGVVHGGLEGWRKDAKELKAEIDKMAASSAKNLNGLNNYVKLQDQLNRAYETGDTKNQVSLLRQVKRQFREIVDTDVRQQIVGAAGDVEKLTKALYELQEATLASTKAQEASLTLAEATEGMGYRYLGSFAEWANSLTGSGPEDMLHVPVVGEDARNVGLGQMMTIMSSVKDLSQEQLGELMELGDDEKFMQALKMLGFSEKDALLIASRVESRNQMKQLIAGVHDLQLTRAREVMEMEAGIRAGAGEKNRDGWHCSFPGFIGAGRRKVG